MTNETFCGNRHIFLGLAYLDKCNRILWKYSKVGKYICLFPQKVSFVTVTLPS